MYRLHRLVEHQGGAYDIEYRLTLVFGTLDAGLATENLALAAGMLRYGTCVISGTKNAVGENVQLPSGVLPVHGLDMGVLDLERGS